LVWNVVRTCLWMRSTGNALHSSVPLAMIVLSGLVHAAFEDWLFAPGYYLCVFFWSVAFILVDVAPWVPMPTFSHVRLSRPSTAWGARNSSGPINAPLH